MLNLSVMQGERGENKERVIVIAFASEFQELNTSIVLLPADAKRFGEQLLVAAAAASTLVQPASSIPNAPLPFRRQ